MKPTPTFRVALCLVAAMVACFACDDDGGPTEPDTAVTTGADVTLDLGDSGIPWPSDVDEADLPDEDDVVETDTQTPDGTSGDVTTPDAVDTRSDDGDGVPNDVDDIDTEDVASTTVPVIAAVGWQGLTMISIDEGLTWCQTDIMEDGHDDLYRGGTYAEGLFVGAHAGEANRGAIRVSSDGHRWTSLHRTNREPDLAQNPMNQWYGGVAYGNGVWLAAGGCGKLARSTDGAQTWEDLGRFSDTCLHIRSMVFHDGQFVFGADDGHWYSSPDGDTLTLLQSDAGSRVTVIDGALSGEIDGKSWSQGRGVCLAGGGSPNFRIWRSTEPGCANPVEVQPTPANLTTFLFGQAEASDVTREALGDELADCLGVE